MNIKDMLDKAQREFAYYSNMRRESMLDDDPIEDTRYFEGAMDAWGRIVHWLWGESR